MMDRFGIITNICLSVIIQNYEIMLSNKVKYEWICMQINHINNRFAVKFASALIDGMLLHYIVFARSARCYVCVHWWHYCNWLRNPTRLITPPPWQEEGEISSEGHPHRSPVSVRWKSKTSTQRQSYQISLICNWDYTISFIRPGSKEE